MGDEVPSVESRVGEANEVEIEYEEPSGSGEKLTWMQVAMGGDERTVNHRGTQFVTRVKKQVESCAPRSVVRGEGRDPLVQQIELVADRVGS
jgi:hypothetical protein